MTKVYLGGVIVADTIWAGRPPSIAADEITLMDGYDVTVGGYGNVAAQATRLFDGVVCGGLINKGDPNGAVITSFLGGLGADTTGLKDTRGLLEPEREYDVLVEGGRIKKIRGKDVKTSASVILSEGSKRGIGHYTGANSVYSPEHVGAEIEGCDAAVVLYAGLLHGWDGRPMADFFTKMKSKGILTVTAANGAENASPETLSKIRTALPSVDVFVCNKQEAKAIAGVGGEATTEEIAWLVQQKMMMREGRTGRLLSVTDGEKGSYLIYCDGEGRMTKTQVPALQVNPVNPTGAGDNYLLGLVHYVVEHKDEFRNGSLNVSEAGKYGSAMGALHISGKMGEMESVAWLGGYVEAKWPKTVEVAPPGAVDRRRDLA